MPRFILDTLGPIGERPGVEEDLANIRAICNNRGWGFGEKPRTLHIIGRRWFQKSYGSTYHTAQIVIDGQTVHTTPRQYGYGDQYLQSAVQWLKKAGHLPADGEHMGNTRFLREESGFDFSYECHDVQRQKDL